MITGKAIDYLLRNSDAVQAFVGQGTAARIYPNVAPQEDDPLYPNIIYYTTANQQQQTMDGPSRYALEETMKITIQAEKYSDLAGIGIAIMSAMNVVYTTIAGIPIQGIFYSDEDENEITDADTNFTLHVKELDFRIIFDLP